MKKLRTLLTLLMLLTMSAAVQPVVAQQKTRPRVALVLGGGGAKGAAHIGALKVVEQSGVKVDYVVGTSIGAIVGGLYSVGYTADELEEMFRSQRWMSLLTDQDERFSEDPLRMEDGTAYVFGVPIRLKKQKNGRRTMDELLQSLGAVRGTHITAMLDSMTHHAAPSSFDSLRIPFRCIATDVRTMSEIVIDSGNLAQAMRASMALPAIFRPVTTDRHILVDGGVLNNLPVDVAREMGADIVIAIDLTQNKPGEQAEEEQEFDLTQLGGLGGIIGWALSRPDQRKYVANRAAADVYINPDLSGYDVTSFSHAAVDDMIGRGEKSARKARKSLKKIRKKQK